MNENIRIIEKKFETNEEMYMYFDTFASEVKYPLYVEMGDKKYLAMSEEYTRHPSNYRIKYKVCSQELVDEIKSKYKRSTIRISYLDHSNTYHNIAIRYNVPNIDSWYINEFVRHEFKHSVLPKKPDGLFYELFHGYRPVVRVATDRVIRNQKDGISLKELQNKFNVFLNRYDEVMRFIGNVIDIDIFNYSDNKKDNTFDLIEVRLNIVEGGRNRKQVIEWLNKYKSFIDTIAISTIEDDKRFKKFGISTNFLKNTKLTLTKDYVLVYTFELKDIPLEKMEE